MKIAVTFVLGAAFLLQSHGARALVFSGFLNDPGNTALVGSDLGPPLFDTASDEANNVALYGFALSAPANVTFTSTGYAAGGADPYFTLFQGATRAATFNESNFFSTGGDFTYTFALTSGAYQVALGVFDNESFAENAGVGTLADGFIGLGEPDSLRSSFYSLSVTANAGAISTPEPAGFGLVLAGLMGVGLLRVRTIRTG